MCCELEACYCLCKLRVGFAVVKCTEYFTVRASSFLLKNQAECKDSRPRRIQEVINIEEATGFLRAENCFRKSHHREARRADVTTRQGCQSSFANRALFVWSFYSPEPAGVSGCRLAREADEVATFHLSKCCSRETKFKWSPGSAPQRT